MWGTSTYLAAYCTSLRLPSDSPANHNRFPASGTGSTILLRKHTPSLSRRFRVLGVSWGGGLRTHARLLHGQPQPFCDIPLRGPKNFFSTVPGPGRSCPGESGL